MKQEIRRAVYHKYIAPAEAKRPVLKEAPGQDPVSVRQYAAI
jgi:hypothetical protein